LFGLEEGLEPKADTVQFAMVHDVEGVPQLFTDNSDIEAWFEEANANGSLKDGGISWDYSEEELDMLRKQFSEWITQS
jgi:hypothetical protein